MIGVTNGFGTTIYPLRQPAIPYAFDKEKSEIVCSAAPVRDCSCQLCRAASRVLTSVSNSDPILFPSKLTRAEMSQHMQARFAAIDANGDGQLTREELSTRMEGKQEERRARMIEKIFEKHDANNDGVLTAEEIQQGRADRMFAALDTDGDGALSEEEFEERRNLRKHGHTQGEE